MTAGSAVFNGPNPREEPVSKRRLARAAWLALFLATFNVAQAAAQTDEPPKLDVAVGLAHMQEEWLDKNLAFGWVLSVRRHLNSRIAIVGEGGGSYTRVEPFPAFFPYSMWVHSVLGGPNVSLISTGPFVVFGKTLVGWVRRSRTNPGSVVTPLDEGAVNMLGVQPGVGVEYRFNRRVALRFQGDYRTLGKTSAIPQRTSETRFMAGFRFGVERQP